MLDSELISLCEEGDTDAAHKLITSKADVNTFACGQSPLNVAVVNIHPDLAVVLIKAGANVNAADRLGHTPIFFAQTAEMASLLLDHGADIDHRNSAGETPLLALRKQECDNFGDVAKLLLSRNADANARDSNDMTVLMRAVVEGSADTVKPLLEHPAVAALVNATTADGDTALTLALRDDTPVIDTVKMLITAGADVNTRDSLDRLPLCIATDDAIVQLLLDSGADCNRADSNGHTPLSAACDGGNVAHVELMLAHGGNIHTRPRHGLSLIMLAAASGNVALLELLLAKGASARDRGDHGHTVMYLAVSNRHAEVAERLIAAGADVNVGYNDSTLLMACKDAQIGALLLDHGADASLRDSHGRDAAFHACIDGATDMVSLFIDRGVNVFSISDSGLTGLMCACSNGHVEVAVMLLQAKGVTKEWVNAVSEDGDTALFFAVSHVLSGECLDSEDIYVDPAVSEHHTSTTCKMTKMLLDAGAEDLPLINGRTGLMEACECGNDGLAKLLLEYNSDINAVDDDGFTALTLGIRRVKIARVLLEADPLADVNFRLPMNNTALFAGAGEFVPDAIKMLLKAGADPRVVADNGCVALMNAADGETVSALIEAAPDTVNQRDECGRTVFHYYSSVGNKCSALQQLCKYMQSSDQQIDININDKDDNGDTALHMPMMYANKFTLELLLENGADVFVTGYEGSTVLMKPFFDDDLVSEVYDDLDVRIFEPEEESEEDRKEADEAISLCLKTVIERILPGEDNDTTVSQDGAEGDEETAAKRRRLLKWQALLE